MSGRITHRNGAPAAASPRANSPTCALPITVMLPKLAYTTAASAWASSHAAHRPSSLYRLEAREGRYDGGETSGPMGPRRWCWGGGRGWRRARRAPGRRRC
ncbi:hypothetical protein OsI_26915 [Oryza sativa Indica Group]|uniref:Os07g0622400 protein n=2 Tax=Oryza sativa TaxID=4530 RepID=Q7XI47_ORYSJ|nr:hypothetical protein OsI_26915 [Oryza sativa Indica Group]BAC79904.1 unknown protein [Oryza sativa Japonica Group]BAF22230.1 Os07g0622400 [Oryza sativa Japonica Group]|eukprot:NP_001060316.1 Os07g0622400 [Oryza sativa Japonica Group]